MPPMTMIDQPQSIPAARPALPADLPGQPADRTGAWLLAVIGSVTDGVVIIDAARHVMLMNGEAEQMFRCDSTQLLGKPFDVLLAPQTRAEHILNLDRFTADPKTARGLRRLPLRLEGRRADGEEFPIAAMVSAVSAQGEDFVVLSLREQNDGSKPVQASGARRKRAVSSQQASEREKRRVSKELYDDLGQRLSVLKLDMDWLEKSLPPDEKLSPGRIAQMQGLLDNIILRTKTIASSLRPPLLDDFGLLPAVTWMVDMFQKKTAVVCTVESNGVVSKPGDPIESAVFRVVQEALLNIERHAQASHVRIVIWHAGNRVDVLVEDNGIGMAPGSENKPGCYGLIAMQERIDTLGGTIQINNIEPQGVAIKASIPVDAALPHQGATP